jgi:SH3 domain-containing protein
MISKRLIPPAVTAAIAAMAAIPAVASAGPVYPTAHDDNTALAMHSAPNSSSARVGGVPAGASVEVLCQVGGERASDRKYGTTTLWDQVRSGNTVGYVTDLYVLTNVDRIPGVPTCGTGATPAPPPPPPAPGNSAVGGPISRAEVMNRSLPWIQRHIMYSQARYTDGYRQDCSGYVSLSWHLQGSPNSTALRSSRYTTIIPRSALQPGDALGHPGHIALFVRWAGGGRAVVREEYDYGHPATEHTWSANTVAKYTAYRYKNIR